MGEDNLKLKKELKTQALEIKEKTQGPRGFSAPPERPSGDIKKPESKGFKKGLVFLCMLRSTYIHSIELSHGFFLLSSVNLKGTQAEWPLAPGLPVI